MTSSAARIPAVEAIATVTRPAVQMPKASAPRSAVVANTSRSARPASAASSAAVAGS